MSLEFNKIFRRTNFVDPPIFTIEYTGTLRKEEMLEPQICEYTYNSANAPATSPKYDVTNVAKWGIEHSNNEHRVMEILEERGNYVKFQLKLLDEKGWSPLIRNKDIMNLRVHLSAHMVEKKEEVKFVGSKHSKVYHEEDCFVVKRIKKPLELSKEELTKRRLCKHED